MNICVMTAECQMELIEYACYSVQADEGLIKQADWFASVKSFSSRLFVKYCGRITNFRRKHNYISQLLFQVREQRKVKELASISVNQTTRQCYWCVQVSALIKKVKLKKVSKKQANKIDFIRRYRPELNQKNSETGVQQPKTNCQLLNVKNKKFRFWLKNTRCTIQWYFMTS